MSYERALKTVELLSADLHQRNKRLEICLGSRLSRHWLRSPWLALVAPLMIGADWRKVLKRPANDEQN